MHSLLGAPGGSGVRVTGETVYIAGAGLGGALGALRGAATVSGSNVWDGPVIFTANPTRIGTEDNGNLTISGNITDRSYNYNLLFRPGYAGTITVSGTSNYWGGSADILGSDVSSKVILGVHNALPTNSLITVGNATLDLNGFHQASAGLGLNGTAGSSLVDNTGAAAMLTLKPAVDRTFAGTVQGNLSLVKEGTNSQTLSGLKAYTGSTAINGGRLVLVPDASLSAMASSVTVNSGGTLGGEATTTGTLTLNANSGLLVDPSTAESFIASTITLPASGQVNVTFSSTFPVGDVLVLTASTPGGISGSASAFRAVGTRGGTFYIDASHTQVFYTPSTVIATLTWKGNSPVNPTFWDINNTTNWDNAGSPNAFLTGDAVVFGDTASTFDVAIQGASVSPASVTFNTASNYTVSGGAIVGTATLSKSGAGTVTLGSANSYDGETTITAGTVVVQNNSALGSKVGGTTVSGGGTLDLGGTLANEALNLGTEVLTVSGIGVAGNGAVVNSGPNSQFNAVQQMVLTGDTTFGGMSRWDLRGTGNALNMGGFTITKTGTNLVALVGSTISNPGNIRIAQGTFGLHLAADLGGSSAHTMTVQNGATLNFYSCPSPNAGTLVLENGSTYFSSVGGVGLNSWSGPVSLLGSATLLANSPFDMTGDLTGAGSITKTGPAAANLMANKYTGNTTVNEGRLVVQLATFATNAIVTVTNGAMLELGFVDTNTVAVLILGGVSKPAGVYSSSTDATFLAGTGRLRVVPGIPNPPELKFTHTSSALQFSWTGSFKLQAQTNSLSVGISTNWADFPGGGSSPVTVPLDATQGSVFFRLVWP